LDKRYRVIKKLGGGAFGEIYKGKKVLSKTSERPWDSAGRRREAHYRGPRRQAAETAKPPRALSL